VIEKTRKVLENEWLQAEIQYDNMIRVHGYRDKGVSWKMIARINKDDIPFFQDNEIEPAERTMYKEMYNKYLISKTRWAAGGTKGPGFTGVIQGIVLAKVAYF
jgi:hypothetical protein